MSLHTSLATICLALITPLAQGGEDKRPPKGVEGYWHGDLADKLPFVIKIARDKDGGWTGDLIVSRALEGLPQQSRSWTRRWSELTLPKAVFEGSSTTGN